MFNWFAKPAQSDEVAERLAEMIGTPAAVVQQVCDFVVELQEGEKLDAVALTAAEARLAPVLEEIVAGLRKQRNAAAPRLLRAYAERFSQAYLYLFGKTTNKDEQAATQVLRAAFLLGRACRLARRTHDDPGALRGRMLSIFAAAHQRGLAVTRAVPYNDMSETSVAQECGLLLLWETAPFDALTGEQIEYFDRFITFFGNRIVLKVTPGTTTPYAVLGDGRVLAPGQGDPTQAILFVGPGTLSGLLAGVLKLPETDPLPGWAGERLPHSNLQTVKAMAERLSATWERKKIKRGSERIVRSDEVRVTGGFDNLRRAVAYSAYVRSGGKLKTYASTGKRIVSERLREVLVGLEDDKPHTPIEVLTAMEAAGDSQAVETWPATDSSSSGYNLVVPAFRAWLAVGGLLAVREQDSIDWQVGIVRRLYNAGGSRRVGIQILEGRALPISVGSGTNTAEMSLAELKDAILILGDERSLMITPFSCPVGGDFVLSSAEGRQRLKIVSLTMENADYAVNVVEVA